MSYTCPWCRMTSYNPNDEQNRYCGNCHAFEEDVVRLRFQAMRKIEEDWEMQVWGRFFGEQAQ